MFEKIGNKKYAVPFVVVILFGCLLSLVFYPMIEMTPKDISFAVLNLDEGVQTPNGEVNAGDTVVENMLSMADSEDSEVPIVWTELSSQKELDEALENNEYYGAFIVPADFSETQIAAQMAAQASQSTSEGVPSAEDIKAMLPDGIDLPDNFDPTDPSTYPESLDPAALAAMVQNNAQATAEDPQEDVEGSPIEVLIDNAKSPLLASQLQANMKSMLSGTGMDVEVTLIHAGEGEGTSSGNPMMSQQISVMLVFILSAMASIVISLLFKTAPGASRQERWKRIGTQALYVILVSLVISLTEFCVLTWLVGVEVSALNIILYVWLVSLGMMLAIVGCANISLPFGVLVFVLSLAFGMGTGILPYEMLPAFWQDWVYPWAPQRYIGEGIRDIMFMDAGAWNKGSLYFLILAIGGIALLGLSGLKKEKAAK